MSLITTDAGPLDWPDDTTFYPAVKDAGTHEPLVGNVLRRFLKPGGVFVDLGAHCGYFSLLAANLVGSEGKVFAFEPVPDNFRLLKTNLADCPAQVQTFNLAAWDCDTHLTLHCSPNNSGDNGIVGKSDWPAVDVQAVRVEEFLPRGIIPTLIKVDVQGAEVQALRGMDWLLCKNQPPLVVEVSPEHLIWAGTSPEILDCYCRSLGYRGQEELGDEKENRRRGYWDVLFTKEPK